ncbi:DUF2202 domain-containing protein [Haloferula rosea]|uniref:DUF2202 domain-containing protein n=1 Tax=Haloferula rosea TaxID=490093 RepID=A0A934VH46_9BACT|nr:DUF2202 domain-containing protein [Haloferula rosea]MBK1828692.1 DUF2202 domain-containing protein [Haloferula rosea]
MKTKTLMIALALSTVASAADSSQLVRLYEEEVLAHDLYVALAEKHPDIRPLQNIPHSEAYHREVMAEILKAEGIAIPTPAKNRRFVTKGLDKTYRQWLKEGSKSEVDACRVGVRLEDHDIADLRQAQTAFPEHKEALASLEAASNNHLRAFHRNLTSRGGEYTAEALPAEDLTKILNSPQECGGCDENCGKGGPGNAKAGKGQGCGKGCQGGAAGAGRGQGNGRGKGPGNGQGRQRGQGRGPGGPGRANR